MLDDWIDGLGATPDRIASLLECQTDVRAPSPFIGDFRSDALGGAVGRIAYPGYLVNGRLPTDPPTFTAPPGGRVRLRIVNAGAETPFRFAVGDHRLLVTHSDGYPVRPVEVDTLILGMGERYDVEFTAGSGVFPIAVVPEGKPGSRRRACGPPMSRRPPRRRPPTRSGRARPAAAHLRRPRRRSDGRASTSHAPIVGTTCRSPDVTRTTTGGSTASRTGTTGRSTSARVNAHASA